MDYEKKISDLLASYGKWRENGFNLPKMDSKLYPYTSMFSPITINKLKIKNRVIMAPMGNISMAEETGRPNEMMLKYFEARAKGGVGLITTGLIPVSFGIDKSLIELGDLSYFPRIDRSRTVYSGRRDLAMLCHAQGAAVFVQLTPGLGRVGNPQCLVTQHKFPRSASFIPNRYMKEVPCLRLIDKSLDKIVKLIGQGAADAKASNLDGVYLHGHEGYLLEQLSNKAFNHRRFGKYADKERFGVEMVKEIRKRVGPDYPIMYRIDLTLALNATYKDRMKRQYPLKKFKKERSVQETLVYMKHLVEAGVDVFDVDMGCYDNRFLPHPPASMPVGCYLELSKIVKDYFRENKVSTNKGQEVPIVGVGKLGYPDIAEKALRDGKCDMVMLGRPLLADPYRVNKAYKGDVDKIIPCIGCQEGCLNEFVEGGHPQCAVNALTSFEFEYPNGVVKAEKSKSCLVIGGGPAGIEAARVLLERGHKVTLAEKNPYLGGQVVEASVAKIKYEMKSYLDFIRGEVEDMKKNPNFTLLLQKEVTPAFFRENMFDVIIVATGAKEYKPKISGIDSPNVYLAKDIFFHPELVKDKNNIVVAGGGMVGIECAYFLSSEYDKKVTVIEMDKYIMNHMCTANRGHLIHYLEENGSSLLNMTRLTKVDPDKLEVEMNVDKNKPDPYNIRSPILPENILNPLEKKVRDVRVKKTIKCDCLIVALGSHSEDSLYDYLVANNAAQEIYRIGDAIKPRRVWEAVVSGFRKGNAI
jgi:2-enoate reductase